MTLKASSRPVLDCDDPAELARVLREHTPPSSISDLWPDLRGPFTDLVLRAGRQTRLRVKTDIRVLAQVAAYLHDQRQPVTVDAVVSNDSLAGHDNYLACGGADSSTRASFRGVLRRLHAVHHDLPWCQERTPYGARTAAMVQPQAAADLAHVLDAARRDTSAAAACFVDAVARARAVRAGTGAGAKLTQSRWAHAQRFAAAVGVELSHQWLTKAVTHEALLKPASLAVLAARYRFTVRDLDLALTHNPDSVEPLTDADRAMLRG